MALTDGNGSDLVMPVAPMYGGNGGGGFGNSGFGGDWAWIILLLLLGWGNNGFGGYGGMGGFAADGAALYPWMNQAEITSGGFRDQMMNNNITSIRDGISDISTQLCNGFAGVNATVNAVASNAETAANARAMANMQQLYGLSSQFADCCCENRLGIADLKYTIATEECATRSADAMNTRDIIDSQTNGTRAILDKLCQLELDNYKAQLDAKNDTIAQLRADALYARGQASQDVQTARILAGQTAEVDALYNRLSQCPIPSEPVFGRQAIFSCNNGCGCGGNNGCGCGNF